MRTLIFLLWVSVGVPVQAQTPTPTLTPTPPLASSPGQGPASAQASAPAPPAGLPPCDPAVRFTASWFADPVVDHSKSAAELAKMAANGSKSAMQLGHVVVETQLEAVPQTSCRGLVVRLNYIKPVLRVASEIPQGSCAYARVMSHEQTHVRIHRDIAQRFRELAYPWAANVGGVGGGSGVGVGTVKSVSSTAVLAYAKVELDRLMRAQVLFDSPEEYAKNHSVCGGEIARLVKPAAVSLKPGQTPR